MPCADCVENHERARRAEAAEQSLILYVETFSNTARKLADIEREVDRRRHALNPPPSGAAPIPKRRFVLVPAELLAEHGIDHPGSQSTDERAASLPDRGSMHALIIEDESMTAFAIKGILRECGFTSFDIAPSAHAAVSAAALRKPDIITADVALKSGCGISALESICNGSTIPTVLITSNAAEVGRRFPDVCVLEKPFDDRALMAAVASAMLDASGYDVRITAKPDLRTRPQVGAL